MGRAVQARYTDETTPPTGCGKDYLVGAQGQVGTAIGDRVGVVMVLAVQRSDRPSLLDVVALLNDMPEQSLVRGQVGTAVEQVDENTILVDFADDGGRTYALAPCRVQDLLVLHYVREAA